MMPKKKPRLTKEQKDKNLEAAAQLEHIAKLLRDGGVKDL